LEALYTGGADETVFGVIYGSDGIKRGFKELRRKGNVSSL
jgi:hypothetical protein